MYRKKTMSETAKLIAGSLAILVVVALFLLAVSLTELYTQLNRYKRYWEASNAQADKSGFVYVAFGDSAAQGVGATRPQNGYVGLVAKALSDEYGEPVQTINLSKSGAKVGDVLSAQLPVYENLKLKRTPVITMEIGANDILSFDSKQFEKEMDQVMERLPKTAIVSDIPFFGGTRFKSMQPRVVVANEIMYRLAQKHGLKLVPLHDKVKSNTSLRTLAVDIFHPSDKAYRENWAPTFLAGIRSLSELKK